MFLLCKYVKIVLRERSVGPKSAKIRVSQTILDKIYGENAQYQQKNQHHKRMKALLTTFRREASLSDLSFGLG